MEGSLRRRETNGIDVIGVRNHGSLEDALGPEVRAEKVLDVKAHVEFLGLLMIIGLKGL